MGENMGSYDMDFEKFYDNKMVALIHGIIEGEI